MFFQRHEQSPPAPPIARQKEFIVENANNLDRSAKIAILHTVMFEVGDHTCVCDNGVNKTIPIVLENKSTKVVSIHLNNIENPDIILRIYNIVYNRRLALNEPARRTAFNC